MRITVSDSGIGMDAETLKHAFEPFYTTKEVGKGTGLGLATVFGIVKQSGGTISVSSEPDEGTSFRIYLPVDAGPREEAGPDAGAGAGATPVKVLLLEDEAKVRNLVGRVLRAAGYEVVEAGSGAEVEEALSGLDAPPDLLVTDVVLPGGQNGRQVADALRARFSGIAVVYMSGYDRDSAVDRQFEDGAGLLEKPFAPEQLIERVKAALSTG